VRVVRAAISDASSVPASAPRTTADESCKRSALDTHAASAPSLCGVVTDTELNRRELERYVQRVSDGGRWNGLCSAGAASRTCAGPAAARARPGVRDRARLRALRRRAVARARLPGRLAVGRARDGRAGGHPLLHAVRVRAPVDALRACARRPSTGSSCYPSAP
jgi:hypothetical protein